MAFDAKRSRLLFQRLSRELSKLARRPAPENVHKFRTHSRRVEALLNEVLPKLSRNDRKLLKLLGRLRKKAGRVRDLDVQISLLRNLKMPQGSGHKAQFMEALVQDRTKREKKLARAFTPETAAELRKRLSRAASGMVRVKDADPLALTLSRLAQLGREHVPLTERTLHQYRIIGKRARYIAELADTNAHASQVVEQLKHMQDVIGDWHDWLKLTQKAESLLGGVRDSSLVSLLHSVTQAKFRLSLNAVAEIRAALVGKRPEPAAAEISSRPPVASRATAA